MPDREKVIKGLECCIRHGENAEVGCGRKDECPYEQNGLKCWLDLNRDALALMKEQEAVKPNGKVRHGANAQIQHFCGNCNSMLHGKPKFCSECGKAVKWE